ncbi:hypothetical protein HOF92_02110 [bacterium]|jgi:hypothetical protein|nr:hypothetical protein [bacterium]
MKIFLRLALLLIFTTFPTHAGLKDMWDSLVNQDNGPTDQEIIEKNESHLRSNKDQKWFENLVLDSDTSPALIYQTKFFQIEVNEAGVKINSVYQPWKKGTQARVFKESEHVKFHLVVSLPSKESNSRAKISFFERQVEKGQGSNVAWREHFQNLETDTISLRGTQDYEELVELLNLMVSKPFPFLTRYANVPSPKNEKLSHFADKTYDAIRPRKGVVSFEEIMKKAGLIEDEEERTYVLVSYFKSAIKKLDVEQILKLQRLLSIRAHDYITRNFYNQLRDNKEVSTDQILRLIRMSPGWVSHKHVLLKDFYRAREHTKKEKAAIDQLMRDL